ncbi:MAG: hypothetical protein HDR77_11470 [Bacteroides sp.]|nr:hypothetical protein [Bacteroides sp.]
MEYHGKVYCCFREAFAHVPTSAAEFGSIRILESTDGELWENIGTISDSNYDLRDPKLSVTPDGRLMLLYGRYLPVITEPHPWTMVKIISDDEIMDRQLDSSDSQEISIENNPGLSTYWLWRVKWIGDTAYGVAYSGSNLPLLVKSTDGENYSLVAVLDVLGNEADVELLPDGRMLIVMRAQDGDGFVGYSYPPYNKWEWHNTSTLIHCPAILTLYGTTYIVGRSSWGTMLFTLQDNDIHPYALLPSVGGDNAYPGIIFRDSQLWISYYGMSDTGISIFLSKVDIESQPSGQ